MDDSAVFPSLKRCIACGNEFPRTKQFFYANKAQKDGLLSRCKTCHHALRKPRPKVPEGQKWCAGCKLSYPVDCFHACKTRHDGLNVYCKSCMHEINISKYAKAKKYGPKEQPPEKLVCGRCKIAKPATLKFFTMNPACRYGLNTTCKQCTYEQTRKRHAQNPEKGRQKFRRHYRRRAAIYFQPRYQMNKDRILARQHAFKQNNPEVVHGWKRRYARSDRGREIARAKENRRRARKLATGGTFTTEQIAEQLKRQHYRCYYCRNKFEKRKGRYVYHIEHTFPLSRVAGTDIPANDMSYLVLACPSCNIKKGNKFPWEWPEGGRLF